MNGITKCVEGFRRQTCIAVKQQNKRGDCGLDGLIARHAEAQISLIENSNDLWIGLADGFRTTIAGSVIDHDDLYLSGGRAPDNGRQAVKQKVSGVIANDNDCNLR
jgi:hypothetical protein